MPISADSTVEKNSDVVARELTQDGEAVLLHLKTGSYHGVDSVGWMIWNLIDGGRTVRDIATEVRSRLDGAPVHVEEDVTAFLEGLRERDLIE
jgi:hypothetical protein